MKKRPKNRYAKDLRTPKYKMRVVPDKKKKAKVEDFSDFCVYCMHPRNEHAVECILRGFA
jgi:hypothetical protein